MRGHLLPLLFGSAEWRRLEFASPVRCD